jgi:isopenicillin-N epimerase
MAAPAPADLRREFLLNPEIAFLNHGSFGACPRPVFERYQAWQLELEREPVDFLARRLPDLLDDARTNLAGYLGCSPQDLAFVPNATTGVNLAAPIPLPLGDPSELVDALFAAASERTRVLYVSHVTSETALVLPVADIVARARELGLVTIVDGAHAPAHVPVDLASLGADFYSGNCHKWLMAPKGSGFLHVQPEHQERVDAAIVSWGYREGRTFPRRLEIQGTRDPAAWLTVPDAIRFQAEREWDEVRNRSRTLAREAHAELCELLGTTPLAPDSMLAQMATVRLPRPAPDLSDGLFARHRVEIPVGGARDDLLRISVAAYTTREDVDRLLAALVRELDAEHRQEDE